MPPSGWSEGEGRAGSLVEGTMSHTQRWRGIYPKLRWVEERARQKPKERFTSLAHYLTEELLLRAYRRLDPSAAPGIDGVTKEVYGRDLEQNLRDLWERLRRGEYRASPVRRCWIEKPGGGRRPLGLPTVEDKIVQGAVVELLSGIYEADFYGFSYGFRPGRSPHTALRALQTVLQKGKVNWVLDADISEFFDTIDHKELMSVIRRRVIGRRLLRLMGISNALSISVGCEPDRAARANPVEGKARQSVWPPTVVSVKDA